MFRKSAQKNKNSFRKKPSVALNRLNNSEFRKGLGRILLVVGGMVLFCAAIYGGYVGIRSLIDSGYRPGSSTFEACSGQLTSIKATPMYGAVFTISGDLVEKIDITAPDGAGLHSLELSADARVMVYFSNNFMFSQIGELLRFSKLEKNAIDYCFLLEQLSLTTGLPVEYIIVNDKETGVISTLPLREIRRIIKQVTEGKKLAFKQNLLPEYRLSDGSSAKVITYAAMKEQFPNFFKIPEIAQEQAFVEVYNSTNIDGYASIISRKWSMLGIEISRVGNSSHEQLSDAVAVVYVKDASKYQRTLAMIKSSLIGGKVIVKEGRPSNVVTTGDIVVFLLKR